ncbi:MAG: hypothetical protein K9K65_13170 [Desulfarculaceae bacterium]|nr:hypothetical protein [Desulfarculaceae bacterium]MCF8047765.1 hypothetical protein [Desulfarculaceae bacterium]MCF8066895.1 hypothetical protein [Desulfarculaceae bacterium]MCF8098785.1 hypothetical protein [Desulfarculaceae bacterium]
MKQQQSFKSYIAGRKQTLIALFGSGSSRSSIGRNLNPPASRQPFNDAVLLIKPSTRIMQAIAEVIRRPPADIFPEKAYLFDQKHTGKASRRSMSNARTTQACDHLSNPDRHHLLFFASKLDHASGIACNLNMRVGK